MVLTLYDLEFQGQNVFCLIFAINFYIFVFDGWLVESKTWDNTS